MDIIVSNVIIALRFDYEGGPCNLQVGDSAILRQMELNVLPFVSAAYVCPLENV